MSRYYEGSGDVSPAGQAEVAYREMRRSLVKYAAVEAEVADRQERGEIFTSVQENILVGKMHAWRDRARLFALVYQVEIDVADRREDIRSQKLA